MGSPFGTVQDAVDSATAGATIALARGTHDGFDLTVDVDVVGACVAETRIRSRDPTLVAVVVLGVAASLRDVTVGPGDDFGAGVTRASGSLILENVVVEDTLEAGVVADVDARLEADRIVVRGTRDGGALGMAIVAEEGAMLIVRRSVLTSNDNGGFAVTSGASADVEHTAIVDAPRGDTFDRAFQAVGGTFTGRWIVVERAREAGGLYANGATVEVEGLVVRDTLGRDDGSQGIGVAGQSDATARIARALIERSQQAGLLITGPHSDAAPAGLVLSDALVRDTTQRIPTASAFEGGGLVVQGDGVAIAERALVVRSSRAGVQARGGGEATLIDVTVRDAMPREPAMDLVDGHGVMAGARSRISADRLEIERPAATGIVVYDGGTMDARDVVIRDPAGVLDTLGVGAYVIEDSELVLERASVERASFIGVLGHAGATLDLTDLTVRDTRSQAADTVGGRALLVQTGAGATVTRARFIDQREFAIAALSTSRTSTFTDIVAEQTVRSECSSPECGDRLYGSGIAALEAFVEVSGFAVRGAELCGVHVAGLGTLDLARGSISGASIGACVQVEGYDTTRLQEDVIYADNGANLQATTLPVPEPTVVAVPAP
jgi:hypothetical protein